MGVYRDAQSQDRTCTILKEYCLTSWPNHKAVDPIAKPYWEARGELTVCDNLLLYGRPIVVPKKLRDETLSKLHQGQPRHITLPPQSPNLSMVARNYKRNHKNDRKVPSVLQRSSTKQGTSHANRTPRPSVAKAWIGSICMRW